MSSIELFCQFLGANVTRPLKPVRDMRFQMFAGTVVPTGQLLVLTRDPPQNNDRITLDAKEAWFLCHWLSKALVGYEKRVTSPWLNPISALHLQDPLRTTRAAISEDGNVVRLTQNETSLGADSVDACRLRDWLTTALVLS
jgi:hypothetical protein